MQPAALHRGACLGLGRAARPRQVHRRVMLRSSLLFAHSVPGICFSTKNVAFYFHFPLVLIAVRCTFAGLWSASVHLSTDSFLLELNNDTKSSCTDNPCQTFPLSVFAPVVAIFSSVIISAVPSTSLYRFIVVVVVDERLTLLSLRQTRPRLRPRLHARPRYPRPRAWCSTAARRSPASSSRGGCPRWPAAAVYWYKLNLKAKFGNQVFT